MKFSIFLITAIYGARNDNRTTERRCRCRSGFQILNSLLVLAQKCFFSFFSSFFSSTIWLDDPHLTNKTASLADEGNSAYFQSSGAHNIKHI